MGSGMMTEIADWMRRRPDIEGRVSARGRDKVGVGIGVSDAEGSSSSSSSSSLVGGEGDHI